MKGNTSILGAVNYAGVTATFTPTSNLEIETTYIVTITTGVKDLADNALISNYTWTFNTNVPEISENTDPIDDTDNSEDSSSKPKIDGYSILSVGIILFGTIWLIVHLKHKNLSKAKF